MRIIMTGGGTGGSISPLLAIHQILRQTDSQAEVLWIGTKHGPEHTLVPAHNIPLRTIATGKLRRYFSWRNYIDPLWIIVGFFQALFIVIRFKPNAILSAGGYVAVPVIWAGWLLRVRCYLHQQDVVPTLSNTLTAWCGYRITVSLESSLKDFPADKVVFTGNPIREDMLHGSVERAQAFFNLDPSLPTVLIMGGGTGSARLNTLTLNSLPELLTFCQIIHLTGGRLDRIADHPRYHAYDFLTHELADAYAAATLAVTRSGMSALSELAALKKPCIIIPLSGSHQEKNAMEFFRRGAAAMLDEKTVSPTTFSEAVRSLLHDSDELKNFSKRMGEVMPADAAQKIVALLYE